MQTFSLTQQADRQTSAALQHVNMGFLARGNKLKPLVSEFAKYHTWLFRVDNNETDVADILQSLPKGAKIVHRKLMKLGDVRVGEVQGKKLRSDVEQHEMIEKISFGIPREPEDFVREAVRAGHPRFLDYKSIEHVDVLIQRNL